MENRYLCEKLSRVAEFIINISDLMEASSMPSNRRRSARESIRLALENSVILLRTARGVDTTREDFEDAARNLLHHEQTFTDWSTALFKQAADGMHQCPRCGGTVEPYDRFCSRCSATLIGSPVTE